jgi:hypothetical protein
MGKSKYRVFNIYLNDHDIYLNDDIKMKWNQIDIKLSNTLFNYPSFLKCLNTYNFIL